MPERFQEVQFGDVARASTNLALIEKRLPGKLWPALPTLLAQVPDPDGALNYLERYLRPEADSARALRYVERNPAALHYLLLVFSYSRFLSETLVQQPDLIEWLHKPTRTRNFRGGIERLKSDEDLEEEFARFESSALDLEPSRVLARFKRREYLRIMLRDVLGLATLADTTFEISLLADVLLRRALRLAQQRLEASYGAAQFTDAAGRVRAAAFTILSLGKLGAQELNYASDVDLMFLYDRDGQTAGGSLGSITNSEFFVRLAHAVLKLITEATPEGAVFRVDLRLRPQGSEGDIALSIPSALDYYRTRAREWELQMLIKARPSAGSVEAGRALLRELHPLVFRPEFNIAAVEAVLNAREEMTRSLARSRRGSLARATSAAAPSTDHSAEWNVKLSPGGIRDIEFLTQCLQRLYGGADPWLASPAAASTLVALQRLHDKGHLSGHDFFRLSSAYQFLRKVEHRLQLRDGLQRHTLPGPDAMPPGALVRLARRCGIEAPPQMAAGLFLSRIREHFSEVQEIYDRMVRPRRGPLPEENPAAAPPSQSNDLLQRLQKELPAAANALRQSGVMADALARRGLDRYLTGAKLEPEVMQQLEANPEWLVAAARLFARSDLSVEMLARNVGDIRLVHGRAGDAGLPSHEGLAANPDAALAAGRTAYRHSLLKGLASSALGEAKPAETFSQLTKLADWALAYVLLFARQPSTPAMEQTRAPFVVLALGRLGTEEMDFGSDADLAFIAADDLTPDQREPWRLLAEQVIHLASSQTRDGAFFPVDTRLRPRGKEGEIVVSASQLCEYLSTHAQAWEAVTWLKARPVAGNLALGHNTVGRARVALASRWHTSDAHAEMRSQLTALRLRMENEGTGLQARGEFKHLPGSFYDIDYILGALSFRCGLVGPPASVPGSPLLQLSALEAVGALSKADAQTLRSAIELFRAADHAHRVVTGRAANRPPEPALAQRMAALLEGWGILPSGSDAASLHHVLQSVRDQVRELYERVFVAG